MHIEFETVKKSTGKHKELVLPEDTLEEYIGKWCVHTLSAQEGIDALDELITEKDEYKENPELITEAVFRKKMIEKATTKDGKPVTSINTEKIPNKLWQILTAANQKLNGLSNEEARFLLEPSASTNKQSTQP